MKKKINNGVFYVAISLIAVLGVVSFAVAYSVNQNQYIENYYEAESTAPEGPSFGAFSGPDIYSDLNIRGTMTTGGSKMFSTSTAEGGDITIQLVQSDLQNYAYIEILNLTNTSDLTYTLPATSTMLAFLPEVGATRSWLIHNATTTNDANAAVIILTGLGMNLVGTGAGSDSIAPEVWNKLTCIHKQYIAVENENITCMLEEFIAAD